jgi:hypothetical protein
VSGDGELGGDVAYLRRAGIEIPGMPFYEPAEVKPPLTEKPSE